MDNAQQPANIDPARWDAYIKAAPNFAVSQIRMEAALMAGVDFSAMLKLA